MPVLKDVRETSTVNLVAIEGGEVVVYKALLAGDIERVQRENGPAGEPGITQTLATIIKEWNLTDEAGNLLPVTKENCAKLDTRDLNVIVAATQMGTDFLAKAAAPTNSSD